MSHIGKWKESSDWWQNYPWLTVKIDPKNPSEDADQKVDNLVSVDEPDLAIKLRPANKKATCSRDWALAETGASSLIDTN